MDILARVWVWLPAVEVAWLLVATAFILLQRRSPSSTLAWIFALAFLPFIGLFVYFFLGPRRFDKRKRRRVLAQQQVDQTLKKPSGAAQARISRDADHLIRLGRRAVGLAAEPDLGRLTIFTSGDLVYQEIGKAIGAATDHIHVEFYIWEADRIGARLRELLVKRAREGIAVRVIVDGFGSPGAHARYWRSLTEAGGEVCRFNAFSWLGWRPRMANFRTHRKLVVVDGHTAFTGGMNVSEVHTQEFAGTEAWRDTHLRVEGDVVAGLQRVFFEDWHYATGIIPDPAPYLCDGLSKDAPEESLLQVVSSGPDENLDAIHKLYVASIAGAHQRVCLTTPYFVPDEALTTALSAAALAGVEVRILVPKAGDVPFVAAAARSYYPELLEVGVRIFEYKHPVLHAKTLVVDDTVAIVGTANADNRSFRLNFEVLVASYDHRTCRALADCFDGDLAQAEEVTLARVRNASLLERLWVSTARLFSPIL